MDATPPAVARTSSRFARVLTRRTTFQAYYGLAARQRDGLLLIRFNRPRIQRARSGSLFPTHALGHTLGDRLVLEGTDWVNLRFVTPLDIALRMGAPFLVERGIDPSEEGLGPALMMRLLLDLAGGGRLLPSPRRSADDGAGAVDDGARAADGGGEG